MARNMARSAKLSGSRESHLQDSHSQDLVGRITDTIANHSRLSAAAAFQMGVLLGQVMQNTGALEGLRRKVAAAPGAIASHLPTFGLFDAKPATRRGRVKTATRRSPAKRTAARRSKRSKGASAD